jgi:hypothetical protein
VKLFRCFRTLERFAKYIGDDPQDFDYPDPEVVDTSNCTNIARASANHRVMQFEHFYWDTSRVHSLVARDLKNVHPSSSSSSNSNSNNNTTSNTTTTNNTPVTLVVRTSSMWPDWIAANEYLGQSGDALSILKLQIRDYFSTLRLPVSKNISDVGRGYLCGALESEYDAYLDFVDRAVNLNETEKKRSLDTAREHCPELGLKFQKERRK